MFRVFAGGKGRYELAITCDRKYISWTTITRHNVGEVAEVSKATCIE